MTDTTDPKAQMEVALTAAVMATPVIDLQDGRLFILTPPNFAAKEVTSKHQLTPWPVQAITLDDRDSLVNYVKRHMTTDSLFIADYDAGTIRAQLDWHPHNQHDLEFGDAGAMAHSATLILRNSEEFTRWDAMEGKLHAQSDFARFLEENAVDICDPEPTTMIEISRDLEAVSAQAFKSRTRLENGALGFTFETETKITSSVQVPTEFSVMIPIYNGEQPDTLRAKFRYRAQAGGLLLGFEWYRVEYQRRAYFNQIATAASEATGLTAVFGRTA